MIRPRSSVLQVVCSVSSAEYRNMLTSLFTWQTCLMTHLATQHDCVAVISVEFEGDVVVTVNSSPDEQTKMHMIVGH